MDPFTHHGRPIPAHHFDIATNVAAVLFAALQRNANEIQPMHADDLRRAFPGITDDTIIKFGPDDYIRMGIVRVYRNRVLDLLSRQHGFRRRDEVTQMLRGLNHAV